MNPSMFSFATWVWILEKNKKQKKHHHHHQQQQEETLKVFWCLKGVLMNPDSENVFPSGIE